MKTAATSENRGANRGTTADQFFQYFLIFHSRLRGSAVAVAVLGLGVIIYDFNLTLSS